MAEDPLCDYTPGKFGREQVQFQGGIEYGVDYSAGENTEITWDEQARQRINAVPAFVRGMVTKRVEAYCRKEGIQRVTAETLAKIRSRMPTPKVFSGNYKAEKDEVFSVEN